MTLLPHIPAWVVREVFFFISRQAQSFFSADVKSSVNPRKWTCCFSQTFPIKLVLLDFGDMDSLPEAVEEILECYGCLDVLIINGSLKVKAPAQTLSLELDKLLMDHNYFGPVTLAKGERDVQPTAASLVHISLKPFSASFTKIYETSIILFFSNVASRIKSSDDKLKTLLCFRLGSVFRFSDET